VFLMRSLTVLFLLGVAQGLCPASKKRQKLPQPKSPTEYNGATWPEGCIDANEGNFFVIGDWGGEFKMGRVSPFRWLKRSSSNHIDRKPQQMVADRMKETALINPPSFVVNVGDNFYPAGVSRYCDSRFPWTDAKISFQFRSVFEHMYKGPGLSDKEWFGVLGNHDYGGHKYDQGWIQSIYYTWVGKRWTTPAQYYMRTVRFQEYTADFFFIDSNVANAYPPGNPTGTCSSKHSKKSCARNNPTGPTDPQDCYRFFQKLWADQKAWLEEKLSQSTARWQILVMHHPPEYFAGYFFELAARHGIDMFLVGHVHTQTRHYGGPGTTALIVSGGGGGICSEGLPNKQGWDDQYGFVDVKITHDFLEVRMHSHGGDDGATIIRSTTYVHPRPRAFGPVSLATLEQNTTAEEDLTIRDWEDPNSPLGPGFEIV